MTIISSSLSNLFPSGIFYYGLVEAIGWGDKISWVWSLITSRIGLSPLKGVFLVEGILLWILYLFTILKDFSNFSFSKSLGSLIIIAMGT